MQKNSLFAPRLKSLEKEVKDKYLYKARENCGCS
jgi:hypothetical protein